MVRIVLKHSAADQPERLVGIVLGRHRSPHANGGHSSGDHGDGNAGRRDLAVGLVDTLTPKPKVPGGNAPGSRASKGTAEASGSGGQCESVSAGEQLHA